MVNRLRFQTVIVIILCAASAWAASFKPIVLDPSYRHDRFDTAPKDIVREFRAFTTSFDGPDDNDGDGQGDAWGIPEWVAYEIRHVEKPLAKAPSRPRPWITDKALHKQGIAPHDDTYRNSGYDRGHLCMKQIAFRMGPDADWNSHTVLNACPQRHAFNAGIWLDLEYRTQDWADRYGAVWVICGPVICNDRPLAWIGDDDEMKIALPDAFFKIVVRETGDLCSPGVLAFLYPHSLSENLKKPYDHAAFLRSVDEIEALTGLDFLTTLPDDVENKVEAVGARELWE